MIIKRGNVFWVNLDPTLGTETKKTRPAVVLSNDQQNKMGMRVIIAPITSVVTRIYPFEVKIALAGKSSKVMLDQIRTVDVRCLRGPAIGTLTFEEQHHIDKALKCVLALA